MELVLLLVLVSVLVLLHTSVFASLNYVRKFWSCRGRSLKQLPPGKTGWPVFGETLEFLSTGRKGTPEKFVMDRMSKHSPHVFKTSLIGENVAVFCGAAGNKFLFSNENKLVKSWWPRNIEIIFPTFRQSTSGEESTKLRKAVLPWFAGPDSLRKHVGIMDSMARTQLEETYYCKSLMIITVLPLAHKYTFSVACRLFLSIDDPQHVARLEKPFRVLVAGVFAVPINFPGTSFSRAIRASKLIRKELLEIIRGRRRNAKLVPSHRGDILDHMLIATTEDEDGNIADKIIGLMITGHDTLSATITFIVSYLADHPHIYDQVLEEQTRVADGKSGGEVLTWEDCQKMKYSWNVACEVLRVATPLQGNFREAITDFTYAGFLIPKGFKLYWTSNSTHKNPDYFPEPEKFDPSRFSDWNNGGGRYVPYAYVPFGGGPSMCPGKDYARVEILAFMYNLVRMFRWEKVLPNEKIVVDPMPMPANGLPIRLHRHNSS